MTEIAIILNLAAASHQLPINLLNAVCYAESNNNPNAIHHDDGDQDSLGLCQVKYKTAGWMGFKGQASDLMLAKINAYYAAKYLKYQMTRYYGDVRKALIAYNKGNAKDLIKTKYSDNVLNIWGEMNMNEWKAGDKVLCINSYGAKGQFTVDKVYTVREDTSPLLTNHVSIEKDDTGSRNGWGDMNFIKLAPSDPRYVGTGNSIVATTVTLTNPSTKASKNDSDKPDLSLIPYEAEVAEAKAFMVGEKKYGRYNYYKGHNASQLIAALIRHAKLWMEGEENDAKDGQPHLGSVRATAAMLIKQQALGTLIDDRPPKIESKK